MMALREQPAKVLQGGPGRQSPRRSPLAGLKRVALNWLASLCRDVFCSANVAELVDAPDLGSGAARCESSSLSVRTTYFISRMDARVSLNALERVHIEEWIRRCLHLSAHPAQTHEFVVKALCRLRCRPRLPW